MGGIESYTLAAGVGLLVVGFAYAAVSDWRDREVTDRLWQVLGVFGGVLGALAVAPGGVLPLVVWAVVAALTLQHMFPWDERLGPRAERWADPIELAMYLAALVVVGLAAWTSGIGPTGAPLSAVAVLASVVIARILFEAGVLYGGADAKALMTAALLVPIFASPVLFPSPGPFNVLAFLPFAVSVLMNAALLSLVVPVALAVRNVGRGEFEFPRGFTGYSMPVTELPRRFVWVRDDRAGDLRDEEEAVETSREDRELRTRVAHDLSVQGIERVWVTPQLPFLVLLAAGAYSALLAGNLVLDLLRLL